MYRDDAQVVRDLTVLHRIAPVAPRAPVGVALTGFLTPPFGPVRAQVGVVTRHEDRVDARTADASTAFTHSQRAVRIDLRALDPVDTPDVVTAAIDQFAPVFPLGTTQVADLAGHDPAQTGDTLRYTVTHRNNGLDAAGGPVVTDRLPDGVTYLAGTLRALDGPAPGPRTDQAGDDGGEYDVADRTVRMRVGTGADALRGGLLRPGETAAFTFDVVVDPDAPETLANTAHIDYDALGTLTGQDGDPATTRVAVTPADEPPTPAAENAAPRTAAPPPGTDPHPAASARARPVPVLTAFCALIVIALAIVAVAVLRSRNMAPVARTGRHRR
ncbi:MAG: DUF11 domain-containing protein [Streptomycetaceae bacterium]|nr:DUF11 domain-containing protein [Streptomycetaceae bacterium]